MVVVKRLRRLHRNSVLVAQLTLLQRLRLLDGKTLSQVLEESNLKDKCKTYSLRAFMQFI